MEARIARLDRDVASGKDAEKILEKMRSREIDILVGTQMVTKGHDLPEVTLVGVIAAGAPLVQDVVEQKLAALTYRANLGVLRTQDQMLGSLLDLHA